MRRQLPAHSPLALGALLGAAGAAVASQDGVGDVLRDYLTDRFDARSTYLVGSGTQALQAAISSAAQAMDSSLVAVPAYSCFDIVTAAVGAECSMVFYDIDPATLTPDLDTVRDALTRGPCALVVNSLNGFPIQWPDLRSLCQTAGVVLIEDAAQGSGGGWDGAEAGTFGDFTVLSFGRGKGWTGGGGGALLERGPSPVLDRLLPPLRESSLGARSLVMSVAQWLLSRPSLFGIPAAIPALHVGETHYHDPGPIEAMDTISAAVVMRHAPRIPVEIAARKRNAATWRALLSGRPGLRSVTPLSEDSCGYLRFPIVPDADVGERLASDRGVRAGVAPGYPRILPELDAAQGRHVSDGDWPGARLLAQRLLTLPTHSMIRPRDVKTIDGLLNDRAASP